MRACVCILYLVIWHISVYIYIYIYIYTHSGPGDRDGTVVKVLCYKSKGRWFDPSWCHWIFH